MWLVELKSSSIMATSICNKFENGIKMALDILRNAGFRGSPNLNLILLAKSYRNRSERQKIRAIKIASFGKKFTICLCLCGARLAKGT